MTDSLLIAITGPTGAGKTTVSAELSKIIEKSVNIDVDYIKHFVVNDFKYDDSNEGKKQWELLGLNIGQIAANFKSQGYNVIINGYIDELAWNKIAGYVQFTHKFLLLPDVSIVETRDRGRDTEIAMGVEAVNRHYEDFSTNTFYSQFIKIDSSSDGVQETVGQLSKYLSK